MTSASQAAPTKRKRSFPDKLATLSGFGIFFVGLSAVGSGIEGNADAYLRTISIACTCIAIAAVSLALRSMEKDCGTS